MVGARLAREIASFDDDGRVGEQLAAARRRRARVVVPSDARYPHLLHEIYDPPPLLWAEGSGGVDWTRCISIVGARRATQYGVRQAGRLASELANAGFTVVSGLAYGIDAAAHAGALEAGGTTVAVLGSGLDIVYPAAHRRLAQQIRDAGEVISEFAFGTRPERTNFPRRNRLISGVSLGVVVVEASEAGGALITARMALEQNREVFAVPGSVFSPASTGPNGLIRDGAAKLVTCASDVLEEILPGFEGRARGETVGPTEDLTESERRLARHLGREAEDLEAICVRAGLEVSSVLATLLTMELKGLVRQLPGKRFSLR